MAVLDGDNRAEAWRETMRSASERFEVIGVAKSDLRAAIDATDQWIDDNAGAYNQALPLAARQALTAKQKSRLFMAVACRRFEIM